jgi:lupus La protein
VDEERKCIRRNPERAIPEHNDEWRSLVAERTIYVKGFPTETTTMDDILKFMSTFGKIDNVFVSEL